MAAAAGNRQWATFKVSLRMRAQRGNTVTRFAPSPTGELHLGHAYAAWVAWNAARREGGRFLLRWEDLDLVRCRREFEGGILNDLEWLGLLPDEKPLRQSDRMDLYREQLERLRERGLVYPCFCTRKAMRAEQERSAGAPQGPEGPLYSGRCRGLGPAAAAERMGSGLPYALRLDAGAASVSAGRLEWQDTLRGVAGVDPDRFGDVILGRKDVPASYHLAVTVDDALQGVTLVTRGEDLVGSTAVHRLLQAVLGLPAPRWRHHRLVRDASGVRLAKRDAALSLRELRRRGVTAEELLGVLREMEGRDDPGTASGPAPGWRLGGAEFRF